MSSPDDAKKGSNQKAGSGNQVSVPSNMGSSETDRLLDIDGLLDMAKLISAVREEGRLGEVGRASSEHVNE